MPKKIYFTRHAQAEHNVASDWTIPDAKLTELGKQQSRELNDMTKDTFQRTAELIVCSPQLRPLETMIIGYPHLKDRLDKEPYRHAESIHVMDLLTEVGPYPCDVPTYPPQAIASALGGIFSGLDFTTLRTGYSSKQGIFAPENVENRAAKVRQWLSERAEQEIVVVAHGDILRQIVDGPNSRRPWANAEVKVFTFKEGSHDLEEVAQVDPKSETNEPTSSQM